MHKEACGAAPGSFKGLPKYTPAAVTRSAKAECSPYQDLEKAYSKTDEDLRKAVNTHSQVFQEVFRLQSLFSSPPEFTTR